MAFWDDLPGSLLKQQHRWVISFGDSDYFENNPSTANKNTIPFYYAKSVDQPSYTIKTVQAKYLFSHTFNFPTRPTWNAINITFYDVLMNRKNASLIIDPTVSLYKNFKKSDGKAVKLREEIVVDGKVRERNITEQIDLKQSTQLFFYGLLQSAGYITPHETEEENNLMRFKSFNFKNNMIKSLVGEINYKVSEILANTKHFYNYKYMSIWHLDANGEKTHGWKLYNPMVTDVKMDRLDYSSENAVTITARIEYDWAAVLEEAKTKIKLGSEKVALDFKIAEGTALFGSSQRRVRDIIKDGSNRVEA